MKKFTTPTLNVEELELLDVITTSGTDCNGYEADPDNVCPLD